MGRTMDHSPPEEINRSDTDEGDTNSQRNEVSSIPLEAILSFPLFWPSTSVFAFFRDAHNIVKDDEVKASKLGITDTDPQANEAIKEDWVTALDPSHWKILKTEGSRAKSKNRNNVKQSKSGQNVLHLLRLIRNKAEHAKELGDDQREILDWFTDGDIDQHKFVIYWTTIFPHFLPFVWYKFYQLRNEPTLKQYYLSHSPDVDSLVLELNLESLVGQLTRALSVHKENGGLLKRYKRSGTEQLGDTLEFRMLASPLLPIMMPWAFTLKVEINETCITSTWINHTAEDGTITESKVNFNLETDNIQSKSCVQSFTIFVGNYMSGSLAKKFFSSCAALPVNVTFLSSIIMNTPDMQEVVAIYDTNNSVKLSEWKFNFSELTHVKQREILQRNVMFQNKVMKFNSLLPNSRLQNELSFHPSSLKWLDGEFLNKLITDNTPSLFGDILVPNSDYYIARRIISRGNNLTSKILRHKSEDFILVTNTNCESLKTLSKVDEFAGESYNQCQPKKRIFSVTSDSYVQDICSKLPKHKNYHVLKFVEKDAFQWLRSRGSMKLLQNQKFLDKTDNSIFEDEFISQLMLQTVRHPIIIADKPGMGKSWLLRSLAEKLSKFKTNFVIFIAMNDFMKELGKSTTKSSILATITKFVAKTSIEENIFKLWVETDTPESGIKCELMFDGMDEVTKHKVEAIKVLKILHKECPSFRLWITVRDLMLEALEESLGVLGYKIVPFEENDQIRFLQNNWQKELTIEEQSRDEYTIALHKFAEKCTKSLLQGASKSSFTNEIAGIPLQCRMVAEVYRSAAKQFLSSGSNNDNTFPEGGISLTHLYEKMVDKKLEEYLRKSIPNLDLSLLFIDFIRLGSKKVHYYLAIKLLFSDYWAEMFSLILINGIQKETIDRIFEVGLIQKQKPITFVHRTFAEYLIALFVFEVATKQVKLDLVSQQSWSQFIVETMLDVVVDNKPVTSSTVDGATFKFPVICYFFNTMLENCCGSVVDSKLVKLMSGGCHDFQNETLFQCKNSVILAAVRNDYLHIFQLLFESLDLSERDKFLSKTKAYHDFILSVSVICSSVNFLKYICTLLEDWYERINNTKYKMSSENLYTAIRKGRCEIVKFLVLEKGFGPDTWADLRNLDKDKLGLLHHCVRRSRSDRRSVLEGKKKIIKFLTELDKSVLEVKDSKGRTPLLLQIDASIMLKKRLVNHGADVNAVGEKYRNTGLHWYFFSTFHAAISPDEYHELLELFTAKNNFEINTASSGNTPLHCAVKTYYDELRHDSLDLFQKQGADFNTQDKDGNTVLHLAILKNCDVGFVKKLISLGSDPYIKNKEMLDAFSLATSRKNSELECLLCTMYNLQNGSLE